LLDITFYLRTDYFPVTEGVTGCNR